MMKKLMIQKQSGVGLLEVLVTMLVVALGLVAIATFQANLMSGSAESKIRSEARALGTQKLEELRNNIEIGTLVDDAVAECVGVNLAVASGYRSVCPADSGSDNIAGTNASFTRTWTITSVAAFLADAPARRNMSVEVSWDSDGGIDSDGDGASLDANERVIVVTETAWSNPASSAKYASQSGSGGGGSGAIPSPRQDASEDVASENVIGEDMAITDLNTSTTGDAGVDPTLQAAATDPGGGTTINITLYQVSPGSHFYTATRETGNAVLVQIEEGVIAVFLCENGFCTHKQNHFGGVVHSVMGTVYSDSGNGLSDITVAWSSSNVSACYNATPVSGAFDSMAYECVFAGNCNATSAGTRTATGTNASIPGCFVDTVVSDTHINNRNVGPGGEFGDVGLLGVVDRTGRREQVCFLEDTGIPDNSSNPLLFVGGSVVLNEDYLLPVTKRFYVTRGFNSGNANKQRSEGINHSYENHNFLIVDRKTGGAANDECHDVATGGGLSIAARDVVRVLNVSDDNAVEAGTAYPSISGTATTVTGSISGSNTGLRLYVPEEGSCFINDDTGGDYVCVSPNGVVPIIYGVSDEHPSAAGTFVNCITGACDWTADF